MSKWEEKKLGEFATFQYGKMPDSSKIVESGYPIYSGYRTVGYYSEYMFEQPQLIVVARGVGGTGNAKISPPYSYVTNLSIIIKLDTNIADMHYVYYQFLCNNLKYLDTGAAQSQITIDNLKHHKVILPNLPTQKRIADILSSYDDLIENNNKRIALLEKAAEELYKEWFVRFRFPGHETAKFVNGLPDGWEIKPLFDVAKVTYGYAFDSSLFCDDITLNPVVRIRDIPVNKTNTYTSEICNEKYLIRENSIIVGMDGIFHMCLWNGDKAYLNQRVVEIESKKNSMSNLYLYYVLLPQIKYWEQIIVGTTVAHLGDKHLKKMTVLLPDDRLCKEMNTHFNTIMVQKNKLFKQNQNLIKQRNLLLPRLMSGKLEV